MWHPSRIKHYYTTPYLKYYHLTMTEVIQTIRIHCHQSSPHIFGNKSPAKLYHLAFLMKTFTDLHTGSSNVERLSQKICMRLFIFISGLLFDILTNGVTVRWPWKRWWKKISASVIVWWRIMAALRLRSPGVGGYWVSNGRDGDLGLTTLQWHIARWVEDWKSSEVCPNRAGEVNTF